MSRITNLVYNLLDQVENLCFVQKQLEKKVTQEKKKEIKDVQEISAAATQNAGNAAKIAGYCNTAINMAASFMPEGPRDIIKAVPIAIEGTGKCFESKYNAESNLSSGKAQIGQRELDLSQSNIEKSDELARKANEVFQATMNSESRAIGG